MGRHIDQITEERIKSAVNIVDVIADFIQLRKRGVEWQGLCPFHDDHSLGSFSVSVNKQMYKCFSCGCGGDVFTFLKEYRETRLDYPDALRYLAHKYSIVVDEDEDERWKNIKPAQPRQIVEQHKEMLVVPRDIVLDTMKSEQRNIFIDWFCHLPWSNDPMNDQRKRVQETLWLYCVGAWSDGRVVFWQIDEQGQPRSAKLMRYFTNGKRDKDKKTGAPGWIHNQQGVRERLDLEHHEYRATLFGMHLLRRYPDAVVNVVESEKTALICANAYGHPERNIWMACGGLQFLKMESLQPLIDSGRKVWIWPDKDGVDKWKTMMAPILNDRISITTKFLEENWTEADGEKADVADITIRHLQQPSTAVQRRRIQVPIETEVVWNSDEPFIDPEELADERVAEWRRRCAVHSSGWGKWPKSRVEGVKTVGEIINEHPIIKTLIK